MVDTAALPGVDAIGDYMQLKNPRQAAWILFQHDGSELSFKERLGLLFFGFLMRMGYVDAQASFVVSKTLDWVIAELSGNSPAVIQLLDHKFLTYFGDPSAGFYAWDVELMKEANYQEMPKQPLVSLAISLRQLALQSEEVGMLDMGQLTASVVPEARRA